MKSLKSLFLLATLILLIKADNFAVLVAGSNGYWNYRHQSDLCHSYQILISRGYKAKNIITFSYNDVAKDSENPFPNQLFNKPTYKKPGVDINKGCVIDYEGDDVKPENYLSVIQGNSTAVKGIGSGRVLTSGENDYVFLTFFDHGAPGLIAFPNNDLYASDLLKAFKKMHSKKMYKQLVYYLEACESGSMFHDLPKDLNIYGVTAANESESSYATYCDSDAYVNGKDLGTCLGDLFSVKWMEDTQNNKSEKYTLQQQFVKVKKQTNESHVMQYGDLSWSAKTPISTFLGHYKKTEEQSYFGSFIRNKLLQFQDIFGKNDNESNISSKNIESRQVKLQYLINKYKKNPTDQNFSNLNVELQSIKYFNDRFIELKNKTKLSGEHYVGTNFDCYKKIVEIFKQKCGVMPEGTYGNYRYLYELCAVNDEKYSADVVEKMC
ncbi:peptidase c13 family protein, putative [Ichthyophthirius multifiliis]|uniref:legumain n=1 Tax=Ichthyophthirius multifiliis TaxID=5932 RepID=G0R6K3_ICHMU|nr:peptidase c13 family protein, putative [Ichthyophthirius multifiliis]EGR26897.1 peptidase c13 family protein, putative [Ichthyophthirius multifiliis]|eukprot:XP_004023781.1 peptidase c13 family protein, putative [Ichthyophthirius multifiliis]